MVPDLVLFFFSAAVCYEKKHSKILQKAENLVARGVVELLLGGGVLSEGYWYRSVRQYAQQVEEQAEEQTILCEKWPAPAQTNMQI